MNSFVSIIIPTFNSASTIEETLESVFLQNYLFWECIIIDDGSNDNTLDLIEKKILKDKRFKCFRRPEFKVKGPSSARNFGVKKAIGDYVVFLDSDDIMAPYCLYNRIAYMNNNPHFDFWVFKMNTFDISISEETTLFNTLPTGLVDESDFYYKLFLQGKFPFVVTCPLWKKASIEALNGFDEFLKMLEDPDLHTRAYKMGMKSKTAIELDVDCYYRISDDYERQLKRENYKKTAAFYNFYFLKKHMIVGDENVKKNYKRIFNLYVFSQKKYSLALKLIVLGLVSKIINLKHVLFAFLLFSYTYMNLTKVKGLGYTKLRHKFNKF